MSIYSDYKYGCMSDDEYYMSCARMNAEDRWERGRYPDYDDYDDYYEYDYEVERDEYYD